MKEFPRVKFLRKALIPKTKEQAQTLTANTEILIASPLKMSQLTEVYGNIVGENLEYMVIDEADKMFEMGFIEQVDSILSTI